MENEDRFIYDLTDDHFKKFVVYCNEWIEIFGLTDWGVNYIFVGEKDRTEMEGNKAQIGMNRNGMTATIYLNTQWERCLPNDYEIRKAAFHEVIGELLLNPLETLASCRFNIDDKDIEYECHRIIRRLENIVMKFIPTKVKEIIMPCKGKKKGKKRGK